MISLEPAHRGEKRHSHVLNIAIWKFVYLIMKSFEVKLDLVQFFEIKKHVIFANTHQKSEGVGFCKQFYGREDAIQNLCSRKICVFINLKVCADPSFFKMVRGHVSEASISYKNTYFFPWCIKGDPLIATVALKSSLGVTGLLKFTNKTAVFLITLVDVVTVPQIKG